MKPTAPKPAAPDAAKLASAGGPLTGAWAATAAGDKTEPENKPKEIR